MFWFIESVQHMASVLHLSQFEFSLALYSERTDSKAENI